MAKVSYDLEQVQIVARFDSQLLEDESLVAQLMPKRLKCYGSKVLILALLEKIKCFI